MAHSNNVIEKFFPIINCIEESKEGLKIASKCVKDGGLNWNDVETCANGTQGWLFFLFLQYFFNQKNALICL